jgi:hypothetical protein
MPGQIVSVLRQELDSMVRVVFLLGQNDRRYRTKLIQQAVCGKKWTRSDSRTKITDREMVEFASTLQGWTKSAYSFGCSFIHLSNLHDYKERDPLYQISASDRATILEHLRYYHGGPLQGSPQFSDIVPFLPLVFKKIAENLECYLKDLEMDRDLNP